MKKLFSFLFLTALLSATAIANTYVPNTFTDPVITSVNNANGQINGGATISLRSALKAADNLGGTHTVTLSTGSYVLTNALPNRQITIGNTAQNITINGNGPANTIISMTADANKDRILLVNPVGTVNNVFTTFSGVKFANGYLTSDTYGGGAIYAGGVGAQGLTITNCLFDNNVAPSVAGNGGIGGAINMFQGTLNVVDSTFTNNKSMDGDAGAIFYILYNQNAADDGVINITRSTFTGNTAKQNGGAISFSAQGSLQPGQTFSVSINKNTFLANTATGYGGAIAANNSAAVSIPQINFNRFVGNISTASATTSGLLFVNSAGSVNATNNWWGCNAGPTTASCNQASGVGVAGAGSLNVANWLQLRHAANPNTIFIPNSTTLTATFLTNSAGTFVPVANLTALIGLPITFNNTVRGTLSGAQTTIQSSGTATATFTANTAGAGSADATVDSGTVTASITIPTGVSSINRTNLSPTNLTSVTWKVTFTNAVSGVNGANFSLVNGGLGGSPAITSVTAVGGAPATDWIVTASTGSGSGTLGLNMVGGAGVSAVIVNLAFTGQSYTIDLVAPNTSITAQPPALTNSAAASFGFTGSDTGVGVASFQYQLDGGSYTTAASPVNFAGLSSASHTFNVRAVDGAGNTDASPATVTWTVDTIPPTVNCSIDITVTAKGYCPSNVNYTVSVSDNLALSLITTNPASGSAFSVGTNTVTLTARDTAGNTNFCTFKVIVLPGAAPQLSIVRSSTNVVVSWANLFPCYTLQFAPVLASNSWSSYPGPFATNGGKIFVTNSTAMSNRFYRLFF
jgi:predicted outer membrane repeat protein